MHWKKLISILIALVNVRVAFASLEDFWSNHSECLDGVHDNHVDGTVEYWYRFQTLTLSPSEGSQRRTLLYRIQQSLSITNVQRTEITTLLDRIGSRPIETLQLPVNIVNAYIISMTKRLGVRLITPTYSNLIASKACAQLQGKFSELFAVSSFIFNFGDCWLSAEWISRCVDVSNRDAMVHDHRIHWIRNVPSCLALRGVWPGLRNGFYG